MLVSRLRPGCHRPRLFRHLWYLLPGIHPCSPSPYRPGTRIGPWPRPQLLPSLLHQCTSSLRCPSRLDGLSSRPRRHSTHRPNSHQRRRLSMPLYSQQTDHLALALLTLINRQGQHCLPILPRKCPCHHPPHRGAAARLRLLKHPWPARQPLCEQALVRNGQQHRQCPRHTPGQVWEVIYLARHTNLSAQFVSPPNLQSHRNHKSPRGQAPNQSRWRRQHPQRRPSLPVDVADRLGVHRRMAPRAHLRAVHRFREASLSHPRQTNCLWMTLT